MKILITGISGQDGAFLSKLINKKIPDAKILGISRAYNKSSFEKKLRQNFANLKIVNINLLDFNEVDNLIKDFKPDVFFNLTGPSSVYESMSKPGIEKEIVEIFENISNSLIKNNIFCNFFQASTSEMFGHNNNSFLSEDSSFQPNSPYASGKLTNHLKVKYLRDKYDWNIYSGIMFNHESEYRDANYLFMKIINSAIKIKNKQEEVLTIGGLDIVRDWSYAEEICSGILQITMDGKSCDYVLGSGIGNSIETVVDCVFSYFNLNYKKFIKIDSNLLRKNDPQSIIANPQKIYKELGWKTNLEINSTISRIIKNYIDLKI